MDASEVILRTRSLTDPPYPAKIYYKGLEVGLTVIGKYNSAEDNYRGSNNIEATEGLIATPEISTRTLSSRSTFKDHDQLTGPIEEDMERCKQKGVAESVPETVTDPTDDAEPVIFTYSNDEYLVVPMFNFIYTLEFIEEDIQLTGTLETTMEAPVSPPEKQTAKGVLTELSNEETYSSNPMVNFTFDQSIIQSFFVNSEPEMNFIIGDPANTYSINELLGTEMSQTDSQQFVPCTFNTTDDRLIIETKENVQPDAVWTFNLSTFGTLPDFIENRLDLDHLLVALDTDDTIMATLTPATTDTLSEWRSTNNNWELDSLQ